MGSTGAVRLLFWGCILFPGGQALSGPEEAEGQEGGSLTVRCMYKDGMQSAPKYWCRVGGVFLTLCTQSVKTSGSEVEATEGLMSIRDSHQDRAFTVTMKQLTMQDAGHYLCGVEKFGFDDTLRVTVTVLSAFSPSQPGDPNPGKGRIHHITPTHRGTKTELTKPTRDHPTAHSTASRGVTSKEEPRVPLGSSDPMPSRPPTPHPFLGRTPSRTPKLTDSSRGLTLAVRPVTPVLISGSRRVDSLSAPRSQGPNLRILTPCFVGLFLLAGVAVTVLVTLAQNRNRASLGVKAAEPTGSLWSHFTHSTLPQGVGAELTLTSLSKGPESVGTDAGAESPDTGYTEIRHWSQTDSLPDPTAAGVSSAHTLP
ncbi:CMRF35-like molecule 9 isoform X1 [Tachyglossus aculeatus]|uniref:CMRF35-like molecule 9 isoform X1 n=1 Tax=Tachyglossus aculeatus TaxID=9261 RepID=UPI0018F7BFC6|nr:CMRF35-like molecule 9 isoform X1 [Tachyglossus aculeatus]